MDDDYVAEDCEFPKRTLMPLSSLEHDLSYESSYRYSEEAFADFLEWRDLEWRDLSEEQIDEQMCALRAEFLRT